MVSSKIIFRSFRFALPKIQLILSNVSANFPFYLFFSVGLFGLDGGALLIALELVQAFSENQEPEELKKDLFNEIEKEDPETENQVEEEVGLEKKKSDPNGVWLGVSILIAVKLAMLIWFS